jgi:hypothetical protein
MLCWDHAGLSHHEIATLFRMPSSNSVDETIRRTKTYDGQTLTVLKHHVEIDLEMKRKTLQSCEKLLPKKGRRGALWQRDRDIVSWLSKLQLCEAARYCFLHD